MAGSKEGGHKRKKQKQAPPELAAAAGIGAAAAASASNARFEEWLEDNGVEWDACVLADTAGMGQGLLAAQQIAEGEVVLSVPDDAVLMPDDCCIAQELQAADLGNGGRGGPHGEAIALVLAVMAERSAGPKSRHAGYIQSLPHSLPGMPLFWPPEHLAALAGTAAADKLAGDSGVAAAAADDVTGDLMEWQAAVELPTRVDEAWRGLVQPFVARNAKKFQRRRPADPNAYGLFLWAVAVVSAYSFELGDRRFQAMVPLWDSLNHITGATNVALRHDEEQEALEMVATHGVAKGAELVNSYGELGNSELLRRFGFFEPRPNPHDCAQAPWASLWEAAAVTTAAATAAPIEGKADAATQQLQEQPLSGKDLKRRWKRLVQRRAASEDGWFRIPLSGEPPAQLVLAAHAALADAAARPDSAAQPAADHVGGKMPAAEEPAASAAPHQHGRHSRGCGGRDGCGLAHGPAAAEVPNGSAANGAAAAEVPSGSSSGSRKKRRKGKRQDGEAAAAAVAPPSAGDVLQLLNTLRSQRLARYPADGAAAAEVPADLAAALQQDPAGAGWRAAATAVVRDGELKCWAAFGGWLAQADAEAVIAGMLLQGMR